MAQIPFWYDEAGGSPWDRLQLGKHVMPGVWSIEATCERDINVKKSKGKDGARMKDRGYQPASITLTGKLSTQEEWEALQRILPELHPRKKGGKRNQITAQHPALALMGLSEIYVKSIKAPTVADGVMTLPIEAIEYTAEPKKKLADFKIKWQQGSTVIEAPFTGVLADSPVGQFIDQQRDLEAGLEKLSHAPDKPEALHVESDPIFLKNFETYKQLH